MSIFGKIKHAVHHASHAAEHAAEEAKKKAEQVAHEAEEAAKKAEQEALKQVSSLGDSIKHDIEHLGDGVKSDINHLGDGIKGDINHISDQVKKDIEHIADQAKDDLEKVVDDVKKEAQKVVADIVNDLKNAFGKIEDAFEHGAIQKAIKTSLAVAKKYPVYPDEIDLILPGGITFAWGDIESKIGTLEKYADKPPSGRDQIMEFIEALAPSSLCIEETVEIDLLVVGSSALEFGGSVTFTADQVDTVLKEVLDQLGVK